MKINNKLKLAAAVAAGMVLVGCGSSSSSSNLNSQTGMASHATQSVADLAAIADKACFAADTCSSSGYEFPADAVFVAADVADGSDITTALEEALFNSDAADTVIVLPKGTFMINASVVISAASNLTLVGHGIDATVLDFEGSEGDDGLSFLSGSNVTIQDLGVHNANKNGIKATGVSGIRFNYTATVWEDALTTETQSAYGIYPVSSSDVLVENSYAKGSNDAGIYVGQSENIVVRNSIAEYNIAGIEIENSNNADVYNNETFDNSGGLLVFDLPGTSDRGFGTNIRIFSNDTYENNTVNVGHGTVGDVPQGTGVLVLASHDVEIYSNTITDNISTGVALTSYFLIDDDATNYGANYGNSFALGWTPTVKNVHIYNNTFTNNSANAPISGLLELVILGYKIGQNATGAVQDTPAVFYDGIGELLANAGALSDMEIAPYSDAEKSCVHDNINNNDADLSLNIASVYDVDPAAAGNFDADGPVATLQIGEMGPDATILNCETTPTRLNAAVVTIAGVVYGCTGDDVDLAACKL
jgi:parallel beta-helix repeat protein